MPPGRGKCGDAGGDRYRLHGEAPPPRDMAAIPALLCASRVGRPRLSRRLAAEFHAAAVFRLNADALLAIGAFRQETRPAAQKLGRTGRNGPSPIEPARGWRRRGTFRDQRRQQRTRSNHSHQYDAQTRHAHRPHLSLRLPPHQLGRRRRRKGSAGVNVAVDGSMNQGLRIIGITPPCRG